MEAVNFVEAMYLVEAVYFVDALYLVEAVYFVKIVFGWDGVFYGGDVFCTPRGNVFCGGGVFYGRDVQSHSYITLGNRRPSLAALPGLPAASRGVKLPLLVNTRSVL